MKLRFDVSICFVLQIFSLKEGKCVVATNTKMNEFSNCSLNREVSSFAFFIPSTTTAKTLLVEGLKSLRTLEKNNSCVFHQFTIKLEYPSCTIFSPHLFSWLLQIFPEYRKF